MRKTRATSTNITQRTNSQSEPSQSLKQPSTEAPTLKGKGTPCSLIMYIYA